MDISVDQAKAKVDEYKALIADERTVEDAAIMAGYRAAARGLGGGRQDPSR